MQSFGCMHIDLVLCNISIPKYFILYSNKYTTDYEKKNVCFNSLIFLFVGLKFKSKKYVHKKY